mmetsp:Transcript_10342/g.17737  ORF Transcript_10342/g.17737 Transcript_10342/m.17737 type:complete len:178 (+) Transcript_10342:1058-1591(+)
MADTKGPTVIHPPAAPTHQPTVQRRVLMLIDESANAENACRWFAHTSMLPRTDHVELLHVCPARESENTGVVSAYKTAKDYPLFTKLESFLLEKDLPMERISRHTITSSGKSAGAIGQGVRTYMENKHVDLVVMGTRGMGAMKKALGLGGVADYVCHNVNVPVIVVPYPAMVPELDN